MSQDIYAFPLLANADIELVGGKYPFGLGISLVRIGKEAADAIASDDSMSVHSYDMIYGRRERHEEEHDGIRSFRPGEEMNYGWAIAVPMPEKNTQFEDQGISRFSVAEVMAQGFCAALRVLLCGDVDAPQGFWGKISDDGILAIEPLRGPSFSGDGPDGTIEVTSPGHERVIDDPDVVLNSDDPRFTLGCSSGTLRGTQLVLCDDNVDSLNLVWRGIARLRGLDNLTQAFSELSFRQMDSRIPKGRPEGKGLSPEEYAKRFQRAWQERLSKTQNKSRLGRALTLFEDAMMTPSGFFWPRPGSDLSLFLQTFIVLETLFVCREGDLGRTVALRAARLLVGGTKEEDGFRAVGEEDEEQDPRKNLYEKILKLYQARNDIMHGHKDFYDIDDTVRARAWKVASWSLQHVLGDPDAEAFKVLSGPEKTDAEEKRVRKFWRDLELA